MPVKGNKTVCTEFNDIEDCQKKMVSNRWNLLIYILAPLFGGLLIGGLIFQLGFIIHNPKTGAAIVGAGMLRNAINGK